jgi:hypothetical protein
VFVFTEAQMNSVAEIIDATNADPQLEPLTPILRAVEDAENGTLLYVGVTPPDSPLADCECDHEHVVYGIVRADGLGLPPVMSGTVEEMFAAMLTGVPGWEDAEPVDAGTFVIDGTPNVPDFPPLD